MLKCSDDLCPNYHRALFVRLEVSGPVSWIIVKSVIEFSPTFTF